MWRNNLKFGVILYEPFWLAWCFVFLGQVWEGKSQSKEVVLNEPKLSRFDHSFGGWFGPTTGHRHLYKLFLFVLPLTVEKVSTDHQHMWPVYRRPLASLHSRLAEKHPRNVHAEIQKGLCNNYLEGVVGKLKGGHKRKWQRERGGGGVWM